MGVTARVAAYCRVSTDQEDQANSFVSQMRFFQTYIEREPDWTLQGIYADEGLSGTSTKKRKQFHQMIQAAREGEIDIIVTKEVSRFARNTVDTLEYTRELRKRGVAVIFLLDNINTMDPDGELRLTILSSIAQEESRKTSDRVKWGQKRCMERGVVFGRSLLGYHVEHGVLSVDPEGAQVVRTIYHKYLQEGKGSCLIARELQAEGAMSSRGRDSWSPQTVLKILKNEKYCGDLIQKKTYTPDFLSHEKKYNRGQEDLVVLRDHHQAIIDRETWDAVQREMSRRRGKNGPQIGRGNRYPLSGKLRCGHCGSSFVAKRKKARDGTVFLVWRCGRAASQGRCRIGPNGVAMGCHVGRQMRDELAVEILREAVQSLPIEREKLIQPLVRMVEEALQEESSRVSGQLERLRQTLERERDNKRRMLAEFLEQTVSRADFQFFNQRCDQQIAALQQQIDTLEGQRHAERKPSDLSLDISTIIRGVVSGETMDAGFCLQLLEQMTVYGDGRVEVAFHAVSGRRTVLLGHGKEVVHCDASVPMSVKTPFASP
jgi:DNA invertase Pin-like site-specific DNA recombinase